MVQRLACIMCDNRLSQQVHLEQTALKYGIDSLLLKLMAILSAIKLHASLGDLTNKALKGPLNSKFS